MIRILGMDPGSRKTGFGVIDFDGRSVQVVAQGVISAARIPKAESAQNKEDDFARRIGSIGSQLKEVFDQYQPTVAVLEKIFLGKNADSAFKLGHIRGVCLYHAQLSGCELAEYAARSVKKGITGSGSATKDQMNVMIRRHLRVTEALKEDAADALGLAVYHVGKIQIAARQRARGVEL